MADQCGNCGAEVTAGGVFKNPNLRLNTKQISIFNFVSNGKIEDMCQKCGEKDYIEAINSLKSEHEKCQHALQASIVDFPMMTISQVPHNADYRIMSMVTANVTVGTGLFSELSQGFSDMFGATNVSTGMALKVNSGEATARSILVNKAVAIGANCIIAVDIDYGITGNNAATVNMQGTAVEIRNLADILSEDAYNRFEQLNQSLGRVRELSRWMTGDFETV